MIVATPQNEHERLRALQALEILDTECEPEFDELVELASAICEVPIGLVSLLDADRQWFKAHIGLNSKDAPRAWAFCNYAIQQNDVFVVEDARKDSRFSSNPLVTDGPQIRFYAGMPVTSPEGYALGTLCVIDLEPKSLTAGQKAALRILASQINTRLELRAERKKLQCALKVAQNAQARLESSEERFRLFMDHSPIICTIKDSQGRFVFYNQPCAERFGITKDEWLGKGSNDLWPEDDARAINEAEKQVAAGQVQRAIEESVHERDGRLSHWRSYRFPLHSSDGEVLIGAASIEITEDLNREHELRHSKKALEAVNQRLENMVRTDSLTGLHNRRGFDERLVTEFSRAKRKKRALSVMVIDVDNFKCRNDTYGHLEGDETLRQLAAALQRTARLTDVVARYGGEEFIILLPETDEREALKAADRMLRAVRNEAWPHCPVTVSIGIATLHPSTRDGHGLIALADEALYSAKEQGKDRAVGYGEYYRDLMAKVACAPTNTTDHAFSVATQSSRT